MRRCIAIIACIIIALSVYQPVRADTREQPYIYTTWHGTTSMQGSAIFEWTHRSDGTIHTQTISCAAGNMSANGYAVNQSLSGYSNINWTVGVRMYIRTTTPQYINPTITVRNPTSINYSVTATLVYDAPATRAGTATAYIDTITNSSRFWNVVNNYHIYFSSGAVPTPTPTPTPEPTPTEYGYTYPYTPPPAISQSGVIDIPTDNVLDLGIIGSVSTLFWGVVGNPGITVVIIIIAVGLLLILLK